MARVLTVDDSKAVRMIVMRQLQGLGHEVDEAEDGEKGLAKLDGARFDLVILDITMPVMDGPAMLGRMREMGDHTPVLMLTSESKRSIIAGLMKAGITDYILKPFKPEELKTKVLKALETGVAADPSMLGGAVRPAPASVTRLPERTEKTGAAVAVAEGARPLVDILVVDDMENVAKRLRQLLPEQLTMNGASSAQAAVQLCRERTYRAILVDNTMPDVNSASLVRQLRLLQGQATFAGMCLRSSPKAAEESREMGCDMPLLKPFDVSDVEDFSGRLVTSEDLVTKNENVLTLAPFKGKDSRLDGYFLQASRLVLASAANVAAACFADVILDLTSVPLVPEKVARLLIDLQEKISKMGLVLRIVAPAEVARTARQYTETATLPVFQSVSDAQKAA
jgi:DNA-binding response OmpR family regulator